MTEVRTTRVRLSGGYSIEHLDRLLRDLEPILSLSAPARLEVDLGGLVHLCPAALALVTASISRARSWVLAGSLLQPPRSPPVDNYLMRMDVYRQWGIEPAEEFERHTPRLFRPCRNFKEGDYQAVAMGLTDALAEACSTDSVARISIRICLDELAENVVHHAEAPDGGYAAAQGWPKRGKFEVGIVDLGIGVTASLRKNPSYADLDDDMEAVRTALESGVTSTPERNAGIGLFITEQLLRANGGILLLRSGTGAAMRGAREKTWRASTALPGTLVTIRARTDQPLNIEEVYRSIDADDGSIET